MSWAAVLTFVKTIWGKFGKEIMIIAGVGAVLFYISILHRIISNNREELASLKISLTSLQSTLTYWEKSRTSMERIAGEQSKILKDIYAKEYTAEKIFIDRVHKQTDIIKEYIKDPGDPVKEQKYWDTEDELWSAILE